MEFKNVVIEAFNYELPETRISSEQIEQRLDPIYQRLRLPHGRLELMTGIKERRTWPVGTKPSDIASKAAQKIFLNSKINKEDIDLLIHASVCRDFLEPATASVVHQNLGLKEECTIFDLSNACLGVMNSFVVAANMIEQGQIKKALIVSGENGGPLLEETINHLLNKEDLTRKNIKSYIASLTIGSAAVAFLLTSKDLCPDAPKLLGGAVLTDSSANHLCQGDGNTDSLMMQTDSEALLKAGINLASKTWKKTTEALSWGPSDFDWVITHQVGSAHEKLTLETLELTNKKTYTTYETLGNTGSAALPVTLIKLMEEDNHPIKGEKIALLGIGSGLSSIMLGVEW